LAFIILHSTTVTPTVRLFRRAAANSRDERMLLQEPVSARFNWPVPYP
jgi:hypothetical protein